LWRLARIARYEREVTVAGWERKVERSARQGLAHSNVTTRSFALNIIAIQPIFDYNLLLLNSTQFNQVGVVSVVQLVRQQ
jgi:hypothetical protein